MRSARPRPLQALAAFVLALATTAAFEAQAQSLQKTAVVVDANGNGLFDEDESVQYTLTFTNNGSNDITDVTIIRDESTPCLAIDIGSIVIEPASGGSDSSSGGALQVDVVPLRPGEFVIITFTASAAAVGDCCNQATWSSVGLPGGASDVDLTDGTPNQPTCHFVTPLPGPDVDAVIDKQVLSAGCLRPGSSVEFRVRIQNVGRHPLRNGAFRDTLDPGFTNAFVEGGLDYDPVTNEISDTPGTYGVGEEVIYTYRATIPCTGAGTLLNTAVFTFEDNAGNIFTRSDSETVTWSQPDMADSTKIWADDPADGDEIVSPGENITFTIVIRNSGLCEALHVTALDDLDPRFVSTAPTLVIGNGGFYDATTRRIEWNATTTPGLDSIPTDGSVTVSFTTQVDPSTPSGDLLPNSVTITPVGSVAACAGAPSVTRTIAMQNGNVPYEVAVVAPVLLRNDYISCRATAFATIAGGGPGRIPVLVPRADPQQCSAPAAINRSHPQTDVLVGATSPFLTADIGVTSERCPQIFAGSGRVLIFYELEDDCTDTLRVTKDAANPNIVVVTW